MTTEEPTIQQSLTQLRQDLSHRTGRGLNSIVAAIFLWAAFTVLGVFITDSYTLTLIYVFGAGLLFPLSLLVSKPLGLDPFAAGNPLGTLAGLLGAMQILFIPLMIGAVLTVPDMVPWFLAVLVGAHFLPFSWVYESRAYILAAAAIPLTAGLIAWLVPNLVTTLVPATVTALLAVTAILLRRENASTDHAE